MSVAARTAMVSCIAAAVAVGAAEFPAALEPTGAERTAIVLNTFVDHGRGNTANDWFGVDPSAVLATRADGLAVTVPGSKIVTALASRSLPVLPHQCYRLSVRARVAKPGLAIDVFNEDLTTPLTLNALETGVKRSFDTGDRRRIAITVVGSSGGSALLRHVEIRRTAAHCTG